MATPFRVSGNPSEARGTARPPSADRNPTSTHHTSTTKRRTPTEPNILRVCRAARGVRGPYALTSVRPPGGGLSLTGHCPSPVTTGATCESRGDLASGGPARLPCQRGPPRPDCGETRHCRRVSLGAASTARARTLVTSPVRVSLPCLPADWTETNCRGYRRVKLNPVKSRFPGQGKSAPGAWRRLGTGCLHPVDNSR